MPQSGGFENHRASKQIKREYAPCAWRLRTSAARKVINYIAELGQPRPRHGAPEYPDKDRRRSAKKATSPVGCINPAAKEGKFFTVDSWYEDRLRFLRKELP